MNRDALLSSQGKIHHLKVDIVGGIHHVVKTVHERFLCYDGDRSTKFMRILFYYYARMRVAYWALNYEFYSGYICSLIILRVLFCFIVVCMHCDMLEITSSVVIGDKA